MTSVELGDEAMTDLRLSVVVVAYDMARELPRTLASLDPCHQRGIDAADYEVLVIDNGSPVPVDPTVLSRFSGQIRSQRIDPATPSPAAAANQGIAEARGGLVGLIIDGARMASPGLLAQALLAARLAERPVITAPAFHLGSAPHMDAVVNGYDQRVEDQLLAASGWEDDGYALFEHSTFAGSSGRGWFGPMGESSSLFLPAPLWRELDGLDERFALPGGGLVNHDIYHRACSAHGTTLVELLGEGTFHQFHGGAATTRRYTWEVMNADHEQLRGHRYRPPQVEPLYVGRVPDRTLAHLRWSTDWAIERAARRQGETGGQPAAGETGSGQ